MEAGRELDALVAEKVMGLRVLFAARAWSEDDWLGSDIPTEENVMAIVNERPENPDQKWRGPSHLIIPHYSTDIAAAWQVVKQMRSRGFSIVLSDHNAGIEVVWIATGQVINVSAETDELAICLAALEVVSNNQ